MASEKFEASNRYGYRIDATVKDGGVLPGEGVVVICDRDYQPHNLNGHPGGVQCSRPVKWSVKGVKPEKDFAL